MRPIRLWVFTLGNLLVVVLTFHHVKVVLSITEVLRLKLLDPALKSSVLVSQLNQFCVDFIYCRHFGCYVLESTTLPKLAIFSIRLLHDILDLCRNQLVIVLTIIFENPFHKF